MKQKIKKIIKQFIPPIFLNIIKKSISKTYDDCERWYDISGRKIKLPKNHKLDTFQKIFPTYDAFLPFLSKYLSNGYIIDIGANIGDTVYAMIDSGETKILCVEPHPIFFRYLQENINKLSDKEKSRVSLINKAIGTTKNISLDINNGTSYRSNKGDVISDVISLDEVALNFNINEDKIELIKIDTDGYDYDCILSGRNMLSKTNALIFYENEFEDIDSLNNYIKAIEVLLDNGYRNFYIFNNYGFFCANIVGKNILYFLNYYSNHNRKYRPEYYDILVCKDTKVNFCDKICERYSNEICNYRF